MRSSGILMHISSLPGAFGIGTMGKEAFAFVDFLKEAGQSCWQILPLTPTGYGDSPYQSCSTFAGNHYLISLEKLVEEGLLKREELETIQWNRREDKVDFGLLYNSRLQVLRLAWERFEADGAFAAFCAENREWLPDFALFMALKDLHGGKPWQQWSEGLKHRREADLAWARKELCREIQFYEFVQYLFFKQWNALHSYAAGQGITVIGDVPIYVPYDSAEVWADPHMFQLDETLNPTVVAGCPPDAFSSDGQLWGNPIYRWEEMKKDGYSWWLKRLAAAGKLYDVVRMDHFRGFESYWAIPFGDTTARNGRWVKGPDKDFIRAVKQGLPELKMIAEDLGYLTQEVLELKAFSGYPGMKVLQFGFDPREPSDYLPHTYTRNTVCYTGTHDNLTMRQWFDTADAGMMDLATRYMNLREKKDYVWDVIRTALASVSDLCIIPMQDYLDLGEEARMNFPGTLSDKNWTWRLKAGMISQDLAKKIRDLTGLYARLGNQT